MHRCKSAANIPAALNSIRRANPYRAPIYVILDNLSAHKGKKVRTWAARNKDEWCFTPTYGSWANPIEAQFGPPRTFVIPGSNHSALTRYVRCATLTPDTPMSWRRNAVNEPRICSERQRPTRAA